MEHSNEYILKDIIKHGGHCIDINYLNCYQCPFDNFCDIDKILWTDIYNNSIEELEKIKQEKIAQILK